MRIKQTGFTLIELVAVVVLLGILAVAALPRFINLQGDAKAGVLKGVEGSLQSAMTQVYAKSLMQGKTGASDTTVTENASTNIEVAYGYPKAVATTATNWDVADLIDLGSGAGSNALIAVDDTSASKAFVDIGYDLNGAGGVSDDNCYIRYTTSAAANAKPTLVITSTGCQ